MAAALIVMPGLSLRAEDDKAQEATVVKAGDGKITLDDKKAKLEELKEGFPVKVTLDDKFVVTKLDAKSKSSLN